MCPDMSVLRLPALSTLCSSGLQEKSGHSSGMAEILEILFRNQAH